jgi:hypothetical protein
VYVLPSVECLLILYLTQLLACSWFDAVEIVISDEIELMLKNNYALKASQKPKRLFEPPFSASNGFVVVPRDPFKAKCANLSVHE